MRFRCWLLACFGVLLGGWLKRKIPLLDRLNIPASIVGGLLYAVAALLLRDRYVNVDADPVLRDLLTVRLDAALRSAASDCRDRA